MKSHWRRGMLRLPRRTPRGAAPGTLVVDPDAPRPTVRIVAYGEKEIVEEEIVDLVAISDFRSRYPVIWVNVDGLGDIEVIRKLGEIFGIHGLALEDVINLYQRPKFESHEGLGFVVVRMPLARDGISTEQISLFFGSGFVLTFQEQAGDCFHPIRERIRKEESRFRTRGSDYLSYALLDAVADAFFPLIDQIGNELEQIETEVLGRPDQSVVRRLHHLKQNLLVLRRAIWPMRDVFSSLGRESDSTFSEETRLYLRDCHDHAVQLMDLVETCRESSSSLMELYLSIVSNRVNDVMKVLTVIATIFIPLSFIAGVYGMNFNTEKSRWNLPELNWAFGYPFALGLMLFAALGMLFYFRRKGWFR